MADRQASAALSDETDPAALCFRSAEDAVNYAHHFTEDSNRRFANLSLNAVERYVKGDVCVVLRVRFDRSARECDLVFIRVPMGIFDSHDPSDDKIAASLPNEFGRSVVLGDDGWTHGKANMGNLGTTESERDQGAMLLGITELIQGPKGIIPSLVWAERPKERRDFRGEVFADAPFAVDILVQSGKVVSERKVRAFEPLPAARDSAGVASLVQNSAEIVGGVENDARQIAREPPRELDFKKILSAFNIILNDFGPWLVVDELIDFHIDLVNVMLCAQERQARTLEEVAHGS